MTPMSRQRNTQPEGTGASMRTNKSRGSPSTARVEGTNSKSNGNDMTSGNAVASSKQSHSGSYRNLFRLPLGVSMMARRSPLSESYVAVSDRAVFRVIMGFQRIQTKSIAR